MYRVIFRMKTAGELRQRRVISSPGKLSDEEASSSDSDTKSSQQLDEEMAAMEKAMSILRKQKARQLKKRKTKNRKLKRKQNDPTEYNSSTATSTASTAPPPSFTAASRGAVDPTQTLRYQLIRMVLILVLFISMHTLFNRYVLQPYFHKRPSRADARQQILSKLCPAGVQGCEYSVPDDFHIPGFDD